jgi:hypothetical protein
MARPLAVLLLALSAFALAGVACNDEGDFLLDENGPDTTGTPPFFQRSPLPSPEPSATGSPAAPNATPVTPFKVTVDESVNVRESPSTQGGPETVVGAIAPGEEKTVIAKVRGEPVEEGNDVWYELEDGSFVYSGAVKEVAQ